MRYTSRRQTARRNAKGAPRGFTLIETSIALLVIMIALLGLSSVFVYGVNYNSGAHVRAVAMAVAQQRMETLRQGDFDEVVSSSEPDVTSAGYHFAVATDVTSADNLRTVTVTVTPQAGSAWMRRPVVLVTQRAGTGTGSFYQ